MRKALGHIILILLTLSAFSCKRYVCPAYYTSYHMGERPIEKYITYFEPDTAYDLYTLVGKSKRDSREVLKPHQDSSSFQGAFFFTDTAGNVRKDGRFGAQPRNKYRRIVKRTPLLDRLFASRRGNFMRDVRAEMMIPKVDTTAVDSLTIASLQKMPQYAVDQLIYHEYIGKFFLQDSTAQDSTAQADSTALEEEPAKWWQLGKKMKNRKKRREAESMEDEEMLTEDPSDPAADPATGEVPADGTTPPTDKKKKKKPKKKKKKKKGEEDELPPDEELPPPPDSDFDW